jgi:hypothetical protein
MSKVSAQVRKNLKEIDSYIFDEEKFSSYFNGKDRISGGGEGWNKMFSFLFSDLDYVKHRAYACIVFSEKPTRLLVTGKTATGKGDGVAINSKIARYLPKFTEDENTAMQVALAANAPEKRPDWFNASVFAKINRTMCHRVALFCLETDIDCGSVKTQWLERYGGPPSGVSEENATIRNMAPETRRIFMARINKFKEERPYWENLLAGDIVETSSESSEEEGSNVGEDIEMEEGESSAQKKPKVSTSSSSEK